MNIVLVLLILVGTIFVAFQYNTPDRINEKNIIRWSNEVWNLSNESRINDTTSKNLLIYGLGEKPLNRTTFNEFWRKIQSSTENLYVRFTHIMSVDDWVAVRGEVTGVVKSTSKPFNFSGGGFILFKDGLIIESHETWDIPEELK